jgi:small subunit ribosomal protein S1
MSDEPTGNEENWNFVVSRFREGDVVKGRVAGAVRGGLLVDIGVKVFLPEAD